MSPLKSTFGSASAFGWLPRTIVQPDSFELIQTYYPEGNSSVIFNIDEDARAKYSMFQVRAIARTNNAVSTDLVGLRFNNDFSASYNTHLIYAAGTNTGAAWMGSGNTYSVPSYYFATGASATSGQFGSAIIDIMGASSSSKLTTIRAYGGPNNGAGVGTSFASSVYTKTDAVTSMAFTLINGGTYALHSVFKLYGLRS